MDQLIKSMLAVGARLSPDNGAGMVIYLFSVSIYSLSITFHIALLEISSKPVQVLIIRENSFSLRTKEIDIPQTD